VKFESVSKIKINGKDQDFRKKKERKRFHEVLKLEFAVNNKERNTTIDCCQPGVLLCGYHILLF